MTWEKLIVENTVAPFGIEASGGLIYLKVVLELFNKNHQFIKDRLEFIENQECKKLGNYPIVSNIRSLKDGKDLLRIKIKVFKNRKLVKMNYHANCLKEDYLKSIDELHLDSKISAKFSIGTPYLFQADGETKSGLNILLDEITIL